jgi:ParB/RepB/Spo0J family partition protein
MSDLDTDFAMPGPDAPSFREGLPVTYRMRADSHYVEDLDADVFAPPIRLLDADAIDGARDAPAPASDFVESVRRHGVLQPLIVRGRGGRYRVISGGKRLAAAVAAGMQRVPCVVQRVDDDEARRLALASNLMAAPRTEAPAAMAEAARPAEGLTVELSRSLSALVSAVNLLSDGSFLSQPFASELVKAEAARAMHLVWALRVLADDAPVSRAPLEVADLVARAREMFVPEQRLRNLRLTLGRLDGRITVNGDRDLLTYAITGLIRAGASLPSADAGGPIAVNVVTEPGTVLVTLSREGLSLPPDWVATAFEQPWPVGAGLTTLALLQAAKRVAEWHGGSVSAASTPTGTTLALALPRAQG